MQSHTHPQMDRLPRRIYRKKSTDSDSLQGGLAGHGTVTLTWWTLLSHMPLHQIPCDHTSHCHSCRPTALLHQNCRWWLISSISWDQCKPGRQKKADWRRKLTLLTTRGLECHTQGFEFEEPVKVSEQESHEMWLHEDPFDSHVKGVGRRERSPRKGRGEQVKKEISEWKWNTSVKAEREKWRVGDKHMQ